MTIFKKEKGLKKVVFCLPCLKEIPFESSKCAFSDSKNASTISIKCLKKHTIKKMLNSNYLFKFLLPLTECQRQTFFATYS